MINTFFKFFYCVCVWGEKPFFFLDKRAIIPPSLFSKRYLKPWSHLNHLQVRLYLVPTILRNYPHTLSQLSGGFSKPTETHQAVAPAYSRSGTWEIHTYFLPPPPLISCVRASCILEGTPQSYPCDVLPGPMNAQKWSFKNLSVPFHIFCLIEKS